MAAKLNPTSLTTRELEACANELVARLAAEWLRERDAEPEDFSANPHEDKDLTLSIRTSISHYGSKKDTVEIWHEANVGYNSEQKFRCASLSTSLREVIGRNKVQEEAKPATALLSAPIEIKGSSVPEEVWSSGEII